MMPGSPRRYRATHAVTQDVPGVAHRVATVGGSYAARVDELTDDIQGVIVGLIPDLRADATDVLPRGS